MSEHDATNPFPRRSTRSLLSAVRDNLQALIAHEIAQAKQELLDGVKRQASGAALLFGAAFCAVLFVLFLLTTIALALSTAVAAWLAWLIVTAALGLITLILIAIGKRRLTQPPQAPQTLTETKAAFTQMSDAVKRPETEL